MNVYQKLKDLGVREISELPFNLRNLNIIGEGAQGTVYLDGSKAIKEINLNINADGAQELLYEIEILKSLQNTECTVQVYDYIIHTKMKKLYIIMEYAEEGNLMDFMESIMDNEGNVNEEKIDKIFDSLKVMWNALLNCLNKLHRHGIYHRDIKPQNILIFKNGDNYIAKFADFGLSCISTKNYKEIVKFAKCPVKFNLKFTGSVWYIDPSFLHGKYKNIDEYLSHSDVWALAMSFYDVYLAYLIMMNFYDKKYIASFWVLNNKYDVNDSELIESIKKYTKSRNELTTKNMTEVLVDGDPDDYVTYDIEDFDEERTFINEKITPYLRFNFRERPDISKLHPRFKI